jgi:hypothetical protein
MTGALILSRLLNWLKPLDDDSSLGLTRRRMLVEKCRTARLKTTGLRGSACSDRWESKAATKWPLVVT